MDAHVIDPDAVLTDERTGPFCMIVSFLVFVTLVVFTLPAAMVVIPYALITRNAGPLYFTGCWIARLAMRVAGIRLQVDGREHIPEGRACIFMANHVSNLDAPALLPNLPGRTSVFLKRPLMKLPVLGYAFQLAGFIPVERTGDPIEAEHAVAEAQRVLAAGIHIATFVEGMRSPEAHLLRFKKGPFYLAKNTGTPCIPVSVFGTEKIIPWRSMRIHPGTAHIVFHPPVDPGDYATRDDLSDAVRALIASALPEEMR